MLKLCKNYAKRATHYFSKYPSYNGFVHLLGGIGIGILITYPLVGSHPVRWSIVFIGMAVFGHWWAGQKTK